MRIAAIVRALVAAGATPEMILATVEAAEAQDTADIEKRRANDAERQARRRAKAETRHVTSRDVTATSVTLSLSPSPPAPPSSTNPNQLPPIVPQNPASIAEQIWSITPKTGRKRSSRPDLDRAVKAAMQRGAEPEAMVSACRAYFGETEPEFAMGVHRLIQNDRWREHLPDPPTISPEDLAAATTLWRQTGRWSRHLGPPPDQPGSLAKLQPHEIAA